MTAIRDASRPGEQNSADGEQAFEGQVREFVHCDVAQLRRAPRNQPVAPDGSSDRLDALIWRVSGASMDEIDCVILELPGVRDMLHQEGERVTQKISGFASLTHADSLAQWKTGAARHQPAR
jgi:hypothetical protein